MKSFREALISAWHKIEESQWVYGRLGRLNSDASYTFDVPGRPGFVYVTIRNASGAQTVVPARNDAGVPYQPKLSVRLKLEHGVYVLYGRGGSENTGVVNPPTPPSGTLPHAHAFTSLSDAPNDYSGAGGRVVAVKTSEDGLEYIVVESGDIAAEISGASTDDTIEDTDIWGYITGGSLVKTTWSVIKATIKTALEVAGMAFTGQVSVTNASYPPLESVRSVTATNNAAGAMSVRLQTSNDMADGFGPLLYFEAGDSGLTTQNILAGIGAVRSGADSSGDMVFYTTNATTIAQKAMLTKDGKFGVRITPVSPLHVYQNDSETGTGAGLTIEQDGSGDSVIQFLLTATRRWVMGVDSSDSNKFKISSTADVGNDPAVTIDVNGNMGLGVTSPFNKLHVRASEVSGSDSHADDVLVIERNANANLNLIANDANGSTIVFSDSVRARGYIAYSHGQDRLSFATAGVEAMLIDSNRNVYVGADALADGQLNVSGTQGFLKINRFQAGTAAAALMLRKSRSASVGSHTIVQNGDALGTINYQGSDGSSYVSAVQLVGLVDGTPGTNDMPGRFEVRVSPDGSASPDVALTIHNNKNATLVGTLTAAGVELANGAIAGGILYETRTQTSNSGTSDTDLASVTIPANTLATNGQSLWFEIQANFAFNTNFRDISINWGGVKYTAYQLTAGGSNRNAITTIRGRIVRVSNTSQLLFTDALAYGLNNDTTVQVQRYTPAATLSSSNTLKVVGIGGASSDVTLYHFIVGWHDTNS